MNLPRIGFVPDPYVEIGRIALFALSNVLLHISPHWLLPRPVGKAQLFRASSGITAWDQATGDDNGARPPVSNIET